MQERGEIDVIADIGHAGHRASADRADVAQRAVDTDLDTLGHTSLGACKIIKSAPISAPVRAGNEHPQFAQDREQYARQRPKPRRPRLPHSPLHAVDREGPRSLQTPSRGHAGGSVDNRLGALALAVPGPLLGRIPIGLRRAPSFVSRPHSPIQDHESAAQWRKTFGRNRYVLLSRRHTACNWRGRMQRLIQILDNVLRVFDSDAEPNGFRAHPCAKLLVLGHLSMGR